MLRSLWRKLVGGSGSGTAVSTSEADSTYITMRNMAFGVTKEVVGISPRGNDEVLLGVITDWNLGRGTIATVVCLADGTTSLYYSNGGAVIGGGERTEVREATKRVLAIAGASSKSMHPVRDHPLPP